MIFLKFPKVINSQSSVIKLLASNYGIKSRPYCVSSDVNKDGIVYYGALTPQIRGVKIFSLMTSSAGVVAQPILYQQITSLGGGMSLTVALSSVVGFFTFVTPFLLHTITKKYVTQIEYSAKDNTYCATTLSLFLRQKKTSFTPEEVEVPDIPGMFSSFSVRGQSLFVDSNLFSSPTHYAKIMGYDKPIDFKMGNPTSSSQEKPAP